MLVAAGLVRVAAYLHVPYPIALVLVGLAVGAIPSLPTIEIDSELVLVVFLPPLLASAGFYASPRELKAEWRPLSVLVLALVLGTMGAVAVVAHELIDGLSWPSAFVLGAVVAPTDPIAASAIARRLGVPRRIVTVIEGESLINDATALVLYRVGVTAV